MTRFLLPLPEAVNLVELALATGHAGDLFIRKSPSATVAVLTQALQALLGSQLPIELIGIRHGEKTHETLATGEEMRKAEDLGEHLRIPMDGRDLNYSSSSPHNTAPSEDVSDFTSGNTECLDLAGTQTMLLRVPEIRQLLNIWP